MKIRFLLYVILINIPIFCQINSGYLRYICCDDKNLEFNKLLGVEIRNKYSSENFHMEDKGLWAYEYHKNPNDKIFISFENMSRIFFDVHYPRKNEEASLGYTITTTNGVNFRDEHIEVSSVIVELINKKTGKTETKNLKIFENSKRIFLEIRSSSNKKSIVENDNSGLISKSKNLKQYSLQEFYTQLTDYLNELGDVNSIQKSPYDTEEEFQRTKKTESQKKFQQFLKKNGDTKQITFEIISSELKLKYLPDQEVLDLTFSSPDFRNYSNVETINFSSPYSFSPSRLSYISGEIRCQFKISRNLSKETNILENKQIKFLIEVKFVPSFQDYAKCSIYFERIRVLNGEKEILSTKFK